MRPPRQPRKPVDLHKPRPKAPKPAEEQVETEAVGAAPHGVKARGRSERGSEVAAEDRGRSAGEVLEEDGDNAGPSRPPLRERFADALPRRSSTPIEMTERRKERADERRRVRVRRGRRTALFLGTALVLAWVLFFSPIFAVKASKVTVSGTDQNVTVQNVKAAVAPYVGTSVFRLNTGAVEKTVAEAFPLVRSVEVKGAFPTGMHVKVEMREPLACLVAGSSCTPIDIEGVALELPSDQTEGLARLTIEIEDQTRGVEIMSEVLGALDPATRARITSVRITSTEQLTFVLDSGAHVAWGISEDNEEKARILQTLLANVTARNYDVSAPSAPVTSN